MLQVECARQHIVTCQPCLPPPPRLVCKTAYVALRQHVSACTPAWRLPALQLQPGASRSASARSLLRWMLTLCPQLAASGLAPNTVSWLCDEGGHSACCCGDGCAEPAAVEMGALSLLLW